MVSFRIEINSSARNVIAAAVVGALEGGTTPVGRDAGQREGLSAVNIRDGALTKSGTATTRSRTSYARATNGPDDVPPHGKAGNTNRNSAIPHNPYRHRRGRRRTKREKTARTMTTITAACQLRVQRSIVNAFTASTLSYLFFGIADLRRYRRRCTHCSVGLYELEML
jgi:hypothetical protein